MEDSIIPNPIQEDDIFEYIPEKGKRKIHKWVGEKTLCGIAVLNGKPEDDIGKEISCMICIKKGK